MNDNHISGSHRAPRRQLTADDKDLDTRIFPRKEVVLGGYMGYVIGRRWDLLVRHLVQREPPECSLAEIPIDPDLSSPSLGESEWLGTWWTQGKQAATLTEGGNVE
jgi:hypothetical protein